MRRDRPVPVIPENQQADHPAPVPDDHQVHAAYAGSESCRDCHRAAYDKWAKSNHRFAERGYREEMDRNAFDPSREITHAPQKSQVKLDAGKRAQVVTLGLDRKLSLYPVVRVIGHDPLRQFLVEAPGGRMQTMELSWDPAKQEWFDVYGKEDRQPGEWGHWTGRGMTWNAMCASCHNTRLRKNYDAASDGYHTAMAEMSVGCEACHGPMKDHVAWQTPKPPADQKDPTIRKFTNARFVETCGACHARRGELTGDMVPGVSFHNQFSLVVPDSSDVYYADGQVRDEDYEYAAFLGSKMHAKGVRCIDCHDPHTGKRLLPGNLLCIRCHSGGGDPPAPVIDPVAHGFHGNGKPSNECTACHMPVTTYMQRHPRHDHGMSIPDPLLTKEFGIPNACNRCHADKDADWALAETARRYGDRMNRPTRERALLFSRARRGDVDARDGLIAFLVGDNAPYWKASACQLLGRWVGDAPVSAVLRAQLRHESPLVRESAVRALEPLAGTLGASLRPLLDDPSRNVRVAAAWALKDKLDLSSAAGRELQHMLDLSSDQPSGRMRLGQLAYARGDRAGAIAQMRKALAWDPNSPPFHHDLALVLSASGDKTGAIRALQEAVRLAPRDAEYHYQLGLAWSEAGSVPHAAAALEEAVKLDPGHARAWYNMGLARSAMKDPGAALAALERAEREDGTDAEIPYARATVLVRLGRMQEASIAAGQALKLRPGYPEARDLLSKLLQR
jgi:tetratricopeptide (TPR) repeat protein